MVATLASAPESDLLERLSGRADVLEVRADLVGDLDVDYLRSHFEGQLLYTLRSAAEGGLYQGDEVERRSRLGKAGVHYDLIDLESARDGDWPDLASVEPRRRIVSWHGEAAGLTGLRRQLAAMREIDSRWWKLVPSARDFADAKLPLALLEGDDSDSVIAFAGGRVGGWTRLLAPRVGAPVVYAAASETPGAVGQPTLDRLVEDYGLPDLPAVRHVFALVGDPVEHSLSPRLHNGLYRQLGFEALYLTFQVDDFGSFWLEMVEGGILERFGMPLAGMSVTMPHKEIALAVAGASSPLAERIGAANTLIRREGVWEAETTDPEGVTRALEHRGIELDGRQALVVGVGGAGRSAAVGLDRAGATVQLTNRTAERGRIAANRLEMSFVQVEDVDVSSYDVLVNATPLGRAPQQSLPLDLDRAREGAVVIDLNYSHQRATALVDAAQELGLEVIEGREILLGQGAPQFRMMTGLDMPMAAARRLLGLGA
jgi:3-dehydroquinate dehydratase/shikimate dehydrogenase